MSLSRVPSFSDRPGFPAGLRVLLIEPDPSDLQAIRAQLHECQYEVVDCANIAEAEARIEAATEDFDLLLCEAHVHANSVKDLKELQGARGAPLVLAGENVSQETKMRGISAGAADFLEKPLCGLKLRNIWQHAVRKILKERSATSLTETAVDASSPRGRNKAEQSSKLTVHSDTKVEAGAQESTGSSHASSLAAAQMTAPAPVQPATVPAPAPPPDPTPAASVPAVTVPMPVGTCTSKPQSVGEAPAKQAGLPNAPGAAVQPVAGNATGNAHPVVAPGFAPPGHAVMQPVQQPVQQVPCVSLQTGLQGMPDPLPGCAWGLPMLPPPIPGLTGPPIFLPAHVGMAAPELYTYMYTQWPRAQCATAAMSPMPSCVPQAASTAPSAHMGAPKAVPMLHGQVAEAQLGCTVGSDESKSTVSPPGWSHEVSAATQLHDISWEDVDMFELSENADDGGYPFAGDKLAQGADSGEQRGAAATAGFEGQASGKAGTLAEDAPDSPGALLDECMPGQVLPWIEDEYSIDGFKCFEGDKGGFFDMIA